MKTTVKKLLSLILVSVFVFSGSFPAFSSASPPDKNAGSGFVASDALRTRGRKIVNARGEKVVLRGVNLGGWLIQEKWMCPVDETDDAAGTLEVLRERFGLKKAYELMNVYRDNWITERDLDLIREAGFNCVRLPFWFRNFYSDDAGTKICGENSEWDLSALEKTVGLCSERGLYVVLDMHGAPGYQGDADHCGKINDCGFFDKNEKGENFRRLAAELWSEIAERFRGNPAVAMYDLLNEPMCDVGAPDVERDKLVSSAYDGLYKAIRKVDPDHIITMESIWRIYNLPSPRKTGWKNVVYQLHFYKSSNWDFLSSSLLTRLVPYNVPVYIGEFRPFDKATWNFVLTCFEIAGFSWTTWTYKGPGKSDWFLYGAENGLERAKIKTDSFDEIARKWGEVLRTENAFSPNPICEKLAPFLSR